MAQLKDDEKSPWRSPHSAPIHSISCSIDGSVAVSAADDGWMKEWSINTGEIIRSSMGCIGGINVWTGPIRAWLPVDGLLIWGVDDHLAADLSFLRAKQRFSPPRSGNLSVQTAPLHAHHLEGHSGIVRALTIAKRADRLCIIAASSDGNLRTWDLLTGELLQAIRGPDKWRWCTRSPGVIELSKDGKMSVAATDGGRLLIWDIEEDNIYHTPDYGLSRIRVLALTPNGHWAISNSQEGVLFWDIKRGEPIGLLNGFKGTVISLAAQSSHAVVAAEDKRIYVWNFIKNKNPMPASLTLDNMITATTIAPDCQTIIAGELSGRMHFLRLEQ